MEIPTLLQTAVRFFQDKRIFIGNITEQIVGIEIEQPEGIIDTLLRDRTGKKRWYWKRAGGKFYLSPFEESNPHINISGTSGYGKSSLCKILLTEIATKLLLPVVVLDVHNEYVRHVEKMGGKVFNLKDISLGVWELGKGESIKEKISENVSIMDRVLKLGDIQAYYLSKCAEKAYERKGVLLEAPETWGNLVPSMQDIINEADCWINSQRWPDKSLVSLRRRLDILNLTGIFDAKTTIPFAETVKQPTCFALAELKSSEAQALFIEIFLRKLYSYMLFSEKIIKGIKLYALIDEAQKVCRSSTTDTSYAGKISAEARKYGIGLITSNQLAKDLDKTIVGNAAITFAFYQKEPKEAEYMVELLAGSATDHNKQALVHETLSKLQQFECLTITSNTRDAVKLRVKPIWERRKQKAAAPLKEEATLQEGSVPLMQEEAKPETVAPPREGLNITEEQIYKNLIKNTLETKNIVFKEFNSQKKPAIEYIEENQKIGIEIITKKEKPTRIKTKIQNRLKEYDRVIVIVHSSLKPSYKKIFKNQNKIEIKTIREYRIGAK